MADKHQCNPATNKQVTSDECESVQEDGETSQSCPTIEAGASTALSSTPWDDCDEDSCNKVEIRKSNTPEANNDVEDYAGSTGESTADKTESNATLVDNDNEAYDYMKDARSTGGSTAVETESSATLVENDNEDVVMLHGHEQEKDAMSIESEDCKHGNEGHSISDIGAKTEQGDGEKCGERSGDVEMSNANENDFAKNNILEKECTTGLKEGGNVLSKNEGFGSGDSKLFNEENRKQFEMTAKIADQEMPPAYEAVASTSEGSEQHENRINSSELSTKFDPSQSIYCLKRFQWRGEHVQIVTQNENGPCPLLAIANVLVLSNCITLPLEQECITAGQLMEHIGDYILASRPENIDDTVLLNYQQNMQDAISIMHKLQTGIDVNVKFTGPQDFELTPECLVFDILNIGLYHGWLVDPQDLQTLKAVGNLSYNQIVEKIIRSKGENVDEKMTEEGLIAENFLMQAASQLTFHGLCELNSVTKEEELCVFFRNNHFSTLYKHKGELFLLVTDQGYLNQSKIIWETLTNVDGESQFVDENFYVAGPITTSQTYTENKSETQNDLTQVDTDYLIALSLQEDSSPPASSQHPKQNISSSNATPQQQEAKDLQLARQLQDEEYRMAHQQSQNQGQPSTQNHMSRNQSHQRQHQRHNVHSDNKTEKCVIL